MKAAVKDIYRLTYRSRIRHAEIESMEVTLRAILETATRRNAVVDVTGALLVCGAWFIQALEGPMPSVRETYERIAKDRRHEQLEVLNADFVRERLFAGWGMCGMQLSPTDSQIVQTLESKGAVDPSKLTPTSALKLLETVRKIQASHVTASARS